MNPILLGAVVLYVLFLAFYAIYGLFLLYHLFRFSPHKDMALVGSAVFLGVTIFLLLVSVGYFGRIAWDAPFTIPTGVGF